MDSGRLQNLAVKVDLKSGATASRLQGLDGKVNRLKGSFQNLGQTMNKFGKWGMTQITLPLLDLGISMLNTASWAEEMGRKFNVVFGEMAAATEQWAHAYLAN